MSRHDEKKGILRGRTIQHGRRTHHHRYRYRHYRPNNTGNRQDSAPWKSSGGHQYIGEGLELSLSHRNLYHSQSAVDRYSQPHFQALNP